MIIPIKFSSLEKELYKIGVHPYSIGIFKDRGRIFPLKIRNVRMPAANILKQEMLARGGDCAIHAGCVAGKIDYSDIILLGSKRQYLELLEKLRPMTFFGIQDISKKLKKFLLFQKVKTTLADGRELLYENISVMGIININNDSFYEFSRKEKVADILSLTEQMLADGARIIDVGGESTRPGSISISVEEEISRVIPAVKNIKKSFPEAIVSVDTYNARTAEEAVCNGADIINDISGLADNNMLEVVKKNNVPIIVMHMKGTPQHMQNAPQYNDVVDEVIDFLKIKRDYLLSHNVLHDKIIVDPGIGFGKTKEHNLSLLNRLNELTALEVPLLLAASRKRVVGDVLHEQSPHERLEGTIALSCQAVYAKAQMIRVHDVKENVRAVRMLEAVING